MPRAQATGLPALSDDSGIRDRSALDGAPGVYTGRLGRDARGAAIIVMADAENPRSCSRPRWPRATPAPRGSACTLGFWPGPMGMTRFPPAVMEGAGWSGPMRAARRGNGVTIPSSNLPATTSPFGRDGPLGEKNRISHSRQGCGTAEHRPLPVAEALAGPGALALLFHWPFCPGEMPLLRLQQAMSRRRSTNSRWVSFYLSEIER